MGTATRMLYEVDTANRALPLVRAIVRDVVHDFRVLRRIGQEQRALGAVSDGSRGTEERMTSLGERVDTLSRRMEGYLRELEDLGLELRDLETGTVDFPTILCGEPAFLCWRMGEERITWWHRANAGFADRQPLPQVVRASLPAVS